MVNIVNTLFWGIILITAGCLMGALIILGYIIGVIKTTYNNMNLIKTLENIKLNNIDYKENI